MGKIIDSKDGFMWMDVTDHAMDVFNIGSELYHLWTYGDKFFRIPIDDEIDLKYALSKFPRVERHMVCIKL
jgi:hypothetical protein